MESDNNTMVLNAYNIHIPWFLHAVQVNSKNIKCMSKKHGITMVPSTKTRYYHGIFGNAHNRSIWGQLKSLIFTKAAFI